MYVVSFYPANHMLDRFVGGVWGIYSSWKNAERAIQHFVNMYNETLYTSECLPNGIYNYTTDKGNYTIEEIEVDNFID